MFNELAVVTAFHSLPRLVPNIVKAHIFDAGNGLVNVAAATLHTLPEYPRITRRPAQRNNPITSIRWPTFSIFASDTTDV